MRAGGVCNITTISMRGLEEKECFLGWESEDSGEETSPNLGPFLGRPERRGPSNFGMYKATLLSIHPKP